MVNQTPRQPVAETDRCAAIYLVTAYFHRLGFYFTLFSLLGEGVFLPYFRLYPNKLELWIRKPKRRVLNLIKN